jgi:cytochrome b involved in lipid metabolism
MNLIRKKYSNEAFFMLNVEKLSVRSSMLPMLLAKELGSNIPSEKIIEWFDQDVSSEAKINNFKNFFGKEYSELNHNYVNYLETINQFNCQFILTKTHLNIQKTKNEVMSKLLVFLSFLGDSLESTNNEIIIDGLAFDLDLFLDAYIGTCNLILSKKIKKDTISVYQKSLNLDNISLFDCFIIKLHAGLIDHQYVDNSKYNPVTKKIQFYYMDLHKKVA